MTLKQLIKKHVKADYGQWFLVSLPSSKWAVVWHSCFEIEDLAQAILMEDMAWFNNQIGFAPPATYSSKKEALEKIIANLQREAKNYPLIVENFEPQLKKARRELALIE